MLISDQFIKKEGEIMLGRILEVIGKCVTEIEEMIEEEEESE